MNSNNKGNIIVSVIFFIAFLIGIIILITDNNLKTDFGSVKPYFIHWYILLGLDIITLVAAIYVLFSKYKNASIVGIIWSLLMILIMVGDILTYSSVGFSTPTQFATYLFGLSKYPQSLSYIPGLYTLLFAVFIINLAISLISYRKSSS